jgi:hypothetical protein
MSNSEGTRICFLQFGSAGMKTLQRGNTSELRLPLVGESDWGSRGGEKDGGHDGRVRGRSRGGKGTTSAGAAGGQGRRVWLASEGVGGEVKAGGGARRSGPDGGAVEDGSHEEEDEEGGHVIRL